MRVYWILHCRYEFGEWIPGYGVSLTREKDLLSVAGVPGERNGLWPACRKREFISLVREKKPCVMA